MENARFEIDDPGPDTDVDVDVVAAAVRAAWDDSDAGNRLDLHLARAEFATRELARAAADQMAAIADVLADARRHPEVYVVIADEPTARDVELATSAAIADIAMRLSISEGSVAMLAHRAETLRARAPRMWAACRDGEVSAANARHLADTLESLPVQSESDGALDAAALELAHLAPARFRERVRVLRERLHPRDARERHRAAAEERTAWHEPGRDGMAWLGVHLTAPDAAAGWERIDGVARHLAAQPGETRTLSQLRADAAADILTGRTDPATEPRVSLGVLVSVQTLLGVDDLPATLEGYGPIDADTARRLAAHAPSFHRILTHPVSSTILDVDRTTYRPPADLKRWLALRDGTCRFPGCGRAAKHCDIDHTVPWSRGGTTRAGNLAHLSRRHHTLKDETRWAVARDPDGRLEWTSPTGAVRTSDPPPF